MNASAGIDHPNPVTRLFRACNPNEPLAPGDPRYVDCDAVRGERLVRLFEQGLRHADPMKPVVKLFAGHRGIGKSSELLRLKALLEKPGDGGNRPFTVVYADTAETLDLNDLDFPDLLVFVAGEVQRQLREANIPDFTAKTTLLTRAWEDLKDLLGSTIEPKELEVGAGFLKLALEIKNRPNARGELRQKIENQSSSLLNAVNDLLRDAIAKLREAGREGLVVMLDGLDKLVLRELEGKSNTHDRLFIRRSEQLASLHAHTVYTVPISLYYSPLSAQLEQRIGEFNVPLPMIGIRGCDRSDPTPNTPGMKKMLEILEKRCKYARVNIADVFDSPETGQYLCQMSGGHPRLLMMFVRAALDEVDSLPITRAAAEKSIRKYANALLREVPDDFWPLLKKFDSPRDEIPKDDKHQQMLLLLHVFEYMNDKPWFEVNPVIRTLAKFSGQ